VCEELGCGVRRLLAARRIVEEDVLPFGRSYWREPKAVGAEDLNHHFDVVAFFGKARRDARGAREVGAQEVGEDENIIAALVGAAECVKLATHLFGFGRYTGGEGPRFQWRANRLRLRNDCLPHGMAFVLGFCFRPPKGEIAEWNERNDDADQIAIDGETSLVKSSVGVHERGRKENQKAEGDGDEKRDGAEVG